MMTNCIGQFGPIVELDEVQTDLLLRQIWMTTPDCGFGKPSHLIAKPKRLCDTL